MKDKKSQAALEFLITYGWVLIVSLIGISSLSFFGVMNPMKLLPDVCVVDVGFKCDDVNLKYIDVDFNENMGLVGIRLVNNFAKDISHAYVVIDPENEHCGGFFGVAAMPPFDPWKAGEARNTKFYLLKTVCESPQDCIDEFGSKYNACLSHLCFARGGECNSSSSIPEEYNCTIITGEEGYTCMDLGEDQEYCYDMVQMSDVDFVICDCAEGDCSYNCCYDTFAKGEHPEFPPGYQIDLLDYGQGFCPGYGNGGEPTCDTGADMSDIKYYTVEFTVFYKFKNANMFHTAHGKVKVANSGRTETLEN